MTTLRDQLLFMRKGGEVTRFHSTLTVQIEQVGQHSYGVAWLVWFLTNGAASANLLMAALAHDLPEQVTGDIPSPTKRAMPEIARASLWKQEDDLLTAHGMNFELTKEEERTLSLADGMDGMFFCIRERWLGNQGVVKIYKNFCAYTQAKNPLGREHEIFMQIQQLWSEVHTL